DLQAGLLDIALELGGQRSALQAAGSNARADSKLNLGAVGHAGLGQQLLGLLDILLERRLAGVAQEAVGNDLLNNLAITGQQCVEIIIVARIADRLARLGLVERRDLGVHTNILELCIIGLDQLHVGVAFERLGLLETEILHDIGVARLDRRLQVGLLGYIAH